MSKNDFIKDMAQHFSTTEERNKIFHMYIYSPAVSCATHGTGKPLEFFSCS